MNIRTTLINAGVRNLKEFGYPGVTSANILTDRIYSGFFATMLRDNLGNGFDDEIKSLLEEVQS